jgi:hypothetical protein
MSKADRLPSAARRASFSPQTVYPQTVYPHTLYAETFYASMAAISPAKTRPLITPPPKKNKKKTRLLVESSAKTAECPLAHLARYLPFFLIHFFYPSWHVFSIFFSRCGVAVSERLRYQMARPRCCMPPPRPDNMQTHMPRRRQEQTAGKAGRASSMHTVSDTPSLQSPPPVGTPPNT